MRKCLETMDMQKSDSEILLGKSLKKSKFDDIIQYARLVNLNSQIYRNQTFFEYALSLNASAKIVRKLMDFGASVNSVSRVGGRTVLMSAIIFGCDVDVIKLILVSSRCLNLECSTFGFTSLIYLIISKKYSLVEKLVIIDLFSTQRVNFNYISSTGKLALVEAIKQQCKKLFYEILKHSAKKVINYIDHRGNTPLIYAIINKMPLESMKALYSLGADIHYVKPVALKSVFMYMCAFGDVELVTYFYAIYDSSMVLKKTTWGDNAFSFALKSSSMRVMGFLISTKEFLMQIEKIKDHYYILLGSPKVSSQLAVNSMSLKSFRSFSEQPEILRLEEKGKTARRLSLPSVLAITW